MRAIAEGATPRRLSPCDDGSAASEVERRNVANEGSMRRAPSSVGAALRSRASRRTTCTVVGSEPAGRRLRVPTTTPSPGNVGSASSRAGAGAAGGGRVGAGCGPPSSVARALLEVSAATASATASGRSGACMPNGYGPYAPRGSGHVGDRRPGEARRETRAVHQPFTAR